MTATVMLTDNSRSIKPAGNGTFKNSVLSFANAGATSLFTTVENLARWIDNFEHKRVGGPPVIEQMLQQGKLNSGKELGYAFGLNIGNYRGLRTVGHGGSDAGFRSTILWFPEHQFGVIVLSNLASSSPTGLAPFCFKDYGEKPEIHIAMGMSGKAGDLWAAAVLKRLFP